MPLGNIIKNQRGLGWIPNPPDKRDFDFDVMGLASSDLSVDCSLWLHVTRLRNQRSSNSCIGKALGNAVSIREHIENVDAGHASSLHPYWYGRYINHSHKRDKGAHIRYVLKAARRCGIPDEAYWPFKLSKVNKQPKPNAQMQAYDRADGKYVAIRDYGTARELAVRAAIDAGFPVLFGVGIDSSFFNDDDSNIIGMPTGSIIGGHAMVIIGYKFIEDYGIVYEILNSWGANWRAGGRAWITAEYLALCHDLSIIYGWRSLQGAK